MFFFEKYCHLDIAFFDAQQIEDAADGINPASKLVYS